MRKLMKRGKTLQETPRLADRKAFRIWPVQPKARNGNKGIQEKEQLGVIYSGKTRRLGETCCLNIQAVS
jgi:hypothetical protein